MTHLLSLLGFIATILILVGIHEWGHFILARCCNVKVLRFSIGFGKPLWRWHNKYQTEYVIAAIPLGGYVKLLDTRETPVPLPEQSFAFDKKPIYQRFAILAAGPLMNIVFAIIAYSIVFTAGITHIQPIIGTVVPHSIAAQANLKPGDEIIAIADRPITNWSSIAMQLLQQYGSATTLKMTIHPATHPTQTSTINLNLQHWQLDPLRPNLLKSLGLEPSRTIQKLTKTQYPPWQALPHAAQSTWRLAKLNIVILYKVVTGVLSWQSLGGPLSIFQSAALAANQGIVIFISFLAFFSVGLAVINLLPIPGLDGAQLLYLVIEWITRKPLSIALQVLLFRLGFILLTLFLIQISLNDLTRLWT